MPAGAGQPGLPTRLVAGLFILKHMHNLSDEVLCARWLENPVLPILLRRTELLPPSAVRPIVADALAPAAGRGAARRADPGEPVGGAQDRRAGDQGSGTGGGRHHSAAEGGRASDRCAADASGNQKLVELAKRNRVPLRQSYLRVAKRAAIMAGRYTHAHQFKRARRQLKFLRTRLGRMIRDIRRKIDGDDGTGGALRPVARSGAAGAQPGSASARSEGLCAACSRGRVHRQGQSPRALRVRLQGRRSPPR